MYSKLRNYTIFKLILVIGICVVQFQFITRYFKKVKISV